MVSCLLLWGSECKEADEEQLLERIGALEEGGCVPPTVQSLFVLAYEAALLAGYKIDDGSDYATLARKNLLAGYACIFRNRDKSEGLKVWFSGATCSCSDKNCIGKWGTAGNKRKRDWMDFRDQFEISSNPGNLQVRFLQQLLGAKLASRVTLCFGVIAIGQEIGERFAKALRQEWAPVLATGLGTFMLMFIVGFVQSLNEFSWVAGCFTWIVPVFVGLLAIGAVVITRFGGRQVPGPGVSVYTPPADENQISPASDA